MRDTAVQYSCMSDESYATILYTRLRAVPIQLCSDVEHTRPSISIQLWSLELALCELLCDQSPTASAIANPLSCPLPLPCAHRTVTPLSSPRKRQIVTRSDHSLRAAQHPLSQYAHEVTRGCHLNAPSPKLPTNPQKEMPIPCLKATAANQ